MLWLHACVIVGLAAVGGIDSSLGVRVDYRGDTSGHREVIVLAQIDVIAHMVRSAFGGYTAGLGM